MSYVYQNPESGGIGADHTGALEYKRVWVVRHDGPSHDTRVWVVRQATVSCSPPAGTS